MHVRVPESATVEAITTFTSSHHHDSDDRAGATASKEREDARRPNMRRQKKCRDNVQRLCVPYAITRPPLHHPTDRHPPRRFALRRAPSLSLSFSREMAAL